MCASCTARDGRGKSGGVRVIYYFHSEAMPLYLLTMFAKNERSNLSKAERNALADLVAVLVQTWLVNGCQEALFSGCQGAVLVFGL